MLKTMHGVIASSGGEPIAWNVQNGVDVNSQVDVTGSSTSISGNDFSPDGVYMYFISTSGKRAHRWTMGTPWNVTTAVDDGIGKSLSFSSLNVDSLRFDPTGTKLFINESSFSSDINNINQYNLTTAWDVNTGPSSPDASFSIFPQTTFADHFNFKPDGTKLYSYSGLTKIVYQYNLSTAWDVNTMSYDNVESSTTSSIFPESTAMNGFFFKPDGTQCYFNGGFTKIFQASLSTAWDITSMVNTGQEFDYSFVANEQGLTWKPDGLRLYVTYGNGYINQFDLA